MIADERQLNHAIEQVGRMHRALAALRAEVLPHSRAQFALMAEGPLDEIRRLECEIEEYSGAIIARQAQAEIWVRLEGAKFQTHAAPITMLVKILDGFRKGIQDIAAFLLNGRTGGRVSPSLRAACDLEVVMFQPGSLRIGLRLPADAQSEFNRRVPKEPSKLAREALKKFLEAASWLGSCRQVELPSTFTDATLRLVLLTALQRIIPTPKSGLESLEISGKQIKDPIRLTADTSAAIRIEVASSRHELKPRNSTSRHRQWR